MMATLPANFYLPSVIPEANEKPTVRFGTMLQAISSGFPTDGEIFDLYAKEEIIPYLQDQGSIVG
jgi:hypothetical protein